MAETATIPSRTDDFFSGILSDTSDLVLAWGRQRLGLDEDKNQPVDVGGVPAGRKAPVRANEDPAGFFGGMTTAEKIQGAAIVAGLLVMSVVTIRWALK